MKFSIVLCLGCVQVALATATTPSSILTTLYGMPDCAADCIVESMGNSTCAATDISCLCRSQPLQGAATECIMETCTVDQQLETRNITEATCGAPLRDRSKPYIIASDVGVVLATVLLVNRFAVKKWLNLDFGLDDWFSAFTVIFGIPSAVINVHGLAHNGLGRDIWTLTPTQIENFAYNFYILQTMYFALVAMVKLNLLFFYLRIFPSRTIKMLLWATVAFTVLFGLAFIVSSVLICHPISFVWTRWSHGTQGTCLNLNAMAWSNAAISIALDLWMLAIPLSQLKTLNLDWKKRIAAGLMFCVGTFVTVVSCLRLQSLVHFINEPANQTWNYWEIALFSTLEINVANICASLPAFRILLVQIFPILASSTYKRYSGSVHGRRGSGSRASWNSVRNTFVRVGSLKYREDVRETSTPDSLRKSYSTQHSRTVESPTGITEKVTVVDGADLEKS